MLPLQKPLGEEAQQLASGDASAKEALPAALAVRALPIGSAVRTRLGPAVVAEIKVVAGGGASGSIHGPECQAEEEGVVGTEKLLRRQ